MNPIVEALPSRPIMRDEVDDLRDSSAIDEVFPVYGERTESRDMAFVLVVAMGQTLYGIGLDEGGWSVIDQVSIIGVDDRAEDVDQDGVLHSDSQAVEDMQEKVVETIDKDN